MAMVEGSRATARFSSDEVLQPASARLDGQVPQRRLQAGPKLGPAVGVVPVSDREATNVSARSLRVARGGEADGGPEPGVGRLALGRIR